MNHLPGQLHELGCAFRLLTATGPWRCTLCYSARIVIFVIALCNTKNVLDVLNKQMTDLLSAQHDYLAQLFHVMKLFTRTVC